MRRPSSIPPAIAIVSSIALASCAGVRKPGPPVRPAANTNPDGPHEPLLFSPPFALATPEDAVVRVVGPEQICTGTLVEDDLVLTAHHCMVHHDTREPDGTSAASPQHGPHQVDASEVQVELGGDYLAWGTVKAKAIVAPPCGEAGGAGDLAIVVLERKLVGMMTMPARLDAPPRMGEEVTPIGFGRCALSPDGIHREARPGGPIRATTLETFVMTAGICPGDSGGPVVTRGSREVVGVVSESAMDADERTTSVTILARIDAYRAVFAAARQIADGANPAELPPLTCGR